LIIAATMRHAPGGEASARGGEPNLHPLPPITPLGVTEAEGGYEPVVPLQALVVDAYHPAHGPGGGRRRPEEGAGGGGGGGGARV